MPFCCLLTIGPDNEPRSVRLYLREIEDNTFSEELLDRLEAEIHTLRFSGTQ